jgi:hypothetical protein
MKRPRSITVDYPESYLPYLSLPYLSLPGLAMASAALPCTRTAFAP